MTALPITVKRLRSGIHAACSRVIRRVVSSLSFRSHNVRDKLFYKWEERIMERESRVFEPVSCHLHRLACEAYYRCLRSGKEMGPQDAAATVIMSVAALEGFINELTTYSNWRNPEWESLGSILDEAEDMNARIQFKYLLAAHTMGQPFDKGAQPYQDFALLVRLRNTLIHPKQITGFNEDGSIRIPNIVQQVVKRTGGGVVPRSAPWYSQICATAVARWACNTTSEVIHAILDRLPNGGTREAFEMVFCRGPDEQDCFQPVGVENP